jgi:hypothetical protein
MASSWEQRAEFQQRVDDALDMSDDEVDEEAYIKVVGEEAGEAFLECLLALHFANKLSAKSLCTICWYASRGGLLGPAAKFAFRPNDPATGHYQRKVDLALGINMHDKSNYHIAVIKQIFPEPCIRCL